MFRNLILDGLDRVKSMLVKADAEFTEFKAQVEAGVVTLDKSKTLTDEERFWKDAPNWTNFDEVKDEVMWKHEKPVVRFRGMGLGFDHDVVADGASFTQIRVKALPGKTVVTAELITGLVDTDVSIQDGQGNTYRLVTGFQGFNTQLFKNDEVLKGVTEIEYFTTAGKRPAVLKFKLETGQIFEIEHKDNEHA